MSEDVKYDPNVFVGADGFLCRRVTLRRGVWSESEGGEQVKHRVAVAREASLLDEMAAAQAKGNAIGDYAEALQDRTLIARQTITIGKLHVSESTLDLLPLADYQLLAMNITRLRKAVDKAMTELEEVVQEVAPKGANKSGGTEF